MTRGGRRFWLARGRGGAMNNNPGGVFLLCRLLVVGPVLKSLALFFFLRVHFPGKTVLD